MRGPRRGKQSPRGGLTTLHAGRQRAAAAFRHPGRFADETEARTETFRWIAFHNHRRRHRRAAMLSPIDHEERHSNTYKYHDIGATLRSSAA